MNKRAKNAGRTIQHPPSVVEKIVYTTSQPGKLKNILGIVIAFIAFCLYAQSISFDFVNDDSLVITENNLVKKGFEGLPTLLKTDKLFGRDLETERMPEYRPVPMAVFAMEWQLFNGNPHLFHLVNVLLYALTCWLLFLLLCHLFHSQNLIVPFVCTLLFSVHPIHTEVVANIKGIDDILCFLFGIVSVLFFLRDEEKNKILFQSLAFISFFFSLLCKETGIVFLIIIPLILYTFSNQNLKRISTSGLLLAFVAGIYFLLRIHVLASIPGQTIEKLHIPFINSLRAAPDFITQKATALYILMKYILLLVFPMQQSFDYSLAEIPVQQITGIGVILGLIFYLFIVIYSFINIRRKSALAFAILFYLITLAPVSNMFLLINWTMAERFLYIPSLGYTLALSLLLIKITSTSVPENKLITLKQFINGNKLILLVTVFVAGIYSVKTIARNADWKNNLTLFSHDVKVVPNCARAHYLYANELLRVQYPATENKGEQNIILDKAIAEYTKTLAIYKEQPYAYQYLSKGYYYKKDYANALANYEIAIKQLPADASTYANMGLLYSHNGELDKALAVIDSALKYDPHYTDARLNRANILLKKIEYTEAIIQCDSVLQYESQNQKAHLLKGIAYLNLQQYDLSLASLNNAYKLDSTNATCIKAMVKAYQNIGDTVNANYFLGKGQRLSGGE